jgi:hypothetical protein
MSLRARIDKLSREFAFGDLFDGCTVEELSINGYFSGEPNERARPGVKRCAAFQGIMIIEFNLRRVDIERRVLEETAKTDEFRKTRGWPVVLTPERRREWEARIAEAEQEAAEMKAEYGIADDATDEQIKARLIELGIEAGLTDKELKLISIGKIKAF